MKSSLAVLLTMKLVLGGFLLFGQAKDTLLISGRVWQTKNLATKTFNNGEPILEIKKKDDWVTAYENKTPAWCYYKNKSENEAVYGVLYNRYAIVDPRGLCPTGWHVSTFEDWKLLSTYNSCDTLAYLLKSNEHWKTGGGSNAYGFNGVPSGQRDRYGAFKELGTVAYFWAFDPNQALKFRVYLLEYDSNTLGYYESTHGEGYSVRCVKD